MRRIVILTILILGLVYPCFAEQKYHIEVLQVSKIELFERAYKGFLRELAQNGIEVGKNLTINRHIIDADVDEALWKKVVILYQIRNTAEQIVDSKPDLVLTISTPATKYAKEIFINAHIPLVFTAVANPLAVGCESLEYAGHGFTGSTLYVDPFVLMSLSKMAVPKLKTLGMVHSDDDNAIAFVEESKLKGSELGINVISEQVQKSDPVIPAAMRLIEKGVEAFGVPLDTYYGLRNDKAAHDLIDLAREKKIPIFAFMNYNIRGGVLYTGSDFSVIGGFSGKQAAMILKTGMTPKKVPIFRQDELNIFTDPETVSSLGISFPQDLLKSLQNIQFE